MPELMLTTESYTTVTLYYIQHMSKCSTLKLGIQILKTADTCHILAQNSAAIVQLRDHESSDPAQLKQ